MEPGGSMNSKRRLTGAVLIVLSIVLATPAGTAARQRIRGSGSRFFYSQPKNIIRAQQALQQLGHLKAESYLPGQYDPPTREAPL